MALIDIEIFVYFLNAKILNLSIQQFRILQHHSDQESQFTSKDFTEFCQSVGITQSMSKAGYPYDNAPMERYYNTLKNELIYLHYYHNDEELNKAVEEFAYVRYNHVRPHSYNNYKTPYEARHGIKKYQVKVLQ